MAYEIPGKKITLVAGADLTNKRYCAATLDANGKVIAAGLDAVIIGVIQLPDVADHAVPVMIDGVSQVVYGGAVTAGDKLSTDADGHFIKATDEVVAGGSVTTVGTPVVGIALTTGAINTIGTMLIK